MLLYEELRLGANVRAIFDITYLSDFSDSKTYPPPR